MSQAVTTLNGKIWSVRHAFPGINMLRFNVFDTNADTAAAMQNFVTTMTGMGIVVEIEDHNYPN